MTHASEQQLVERAMGHAAKAEELDRHVQACGECRERLAQIEGTLAALAAWPPPERSADYGEVVWQRIASHLDQKRVKRAGWRWRGPALAGGLAVLVVGILLLGRLAPKPAAPTPAAVASGRSRVLRVAVARHLDRTQMLLLELAHASGAGASQPIDLAPEQEWARELIASNRLYQQGADASGEVAMAHLLGALEPVLLQIAHSPAEVAPAQWRELQSRIAASGILFKVRVADQDLRAHAQTQEEDGL